MPRTHRSALTAPRTLRVPAVLLALTAAACDKPPTRPSEVREAAPPQVAEPVSEPTVLLPKGAGGPVITLYVGARADSVLRAKAATLETLGDAPSRLQLQELREQLVTPSAPGVESSRPRPDGANRIINSGEGGFTPSYPPPFAKIIGTPKLGLLVRGDYATGTITALMQGTHLRSDMHFAATSQIPGYDIPDYKFTGTALNSAVLDCLNYNLSCDLIGTAQVVADLRGLAPCGMKVTFGGISQALVSAFGVAVSLYGKMSWSPGYISTGTWVAVPDVQRESERCTPPEVHIRVQGFNATYEGGTLYDTISNVGGYNLILDGTGTKAGNTPNVSWAWYVDGALISDKIATVYSPTDGMHTYEFRVRNQLGLEGRASAKAIRIDPPDTTTTTTTDSSSTGGGGGTEDHDGGGAGEICYDWFWYYPDTGDIEYIGETCGNEPPPSEVNQMSRTPSASGRLSFSVSGGAGALAGVQSKGGVVSSGTITLVLTDRVPAGSHAALYAPEGRVDGAYLLVSPDATPKELAGAMEGARRQLGRSFAQNALVNPVRFDPDFTWIEPRMPALGRMLSDLRRAPVTTLAGFGSVRTLVVPLGK